MGDGALTKADMAERLFEELGLNKREAKEIVEQFFEEIRLSLEQNEQVKFCLLYTSPSPRDQRGSRLPASA